MKGIEEVLENTAKIELGTMSFCVFVPIIIVADVNEFLKKITTSVIADGIFKEIHEYEEMLKIKGSTFAIGFINEKGSLIASLQLTTNHLIFQDRVYTFDNKAGNKLISFLREYFEEIEKSYTTALNQIIQYHTNQK